MKDRIKKIRKELDLTQQEFADRIGIKRNSVAKYETGENSPSTASISLMCTKFNINEDWLRNGNGEMFLPQDRQTEIAKLTKQLLNEEPDSFKNRLVSVLVNLTEEQWELLADMAEKLVKKKTE